MSEARTILTYLQIFSYHIHITWLRPDFHIRRGGGGGGGGRQDSGHCSTFIRGKPLDIFDKGPQRFNRSVIF